MKSIFLSTLLVLSTFNLFAQKLGCIDIQASNYNSSATTNDGSCIYNVSSFSATSVKVLPSYLQETSGLIFWNNRIWSHNDDTDIKLYSINPNDINDIQSYPLSDVVNKDWEEISQDSAYIYIGDIGNNSNGNRTDLKIYRIEKKSLLNNSPIIDTIFFSYALQKDFAATGLNNTNFDCEAFIVSKDSIYLFTKEWVSKKTTIYALPKAPGTYVAQFRNSYYINGLITGATFLEAKKLIALSGYSINLEPFVFLLYDYGKNNFFSGNKRKLGFNALFHQMEGIATENGLLYYLSNEKFVKSIISVEPKIQTADLSPYLQNYLDGQISSIDKRSSETIFIYPNPISNYLTVDLGPYSIGAEYEMMDVLGQVVAHGSLNSGTTNINMEELQKGVYYIVIDKTVFKHILKN